MPKGPLVAVVRVGGGGVARATVEALKLARAEEAVSGRPVALVKPNYIIAKHPSTGVTTSAEVVGGVLEFLSSVGVRAIIGEGSGFSNTFDAFRVAGIPEVARRYGAELLDLNADEMVEVRPAWASALKSVRIAKTALECGCVISVAKLKTHSLAGVSLSLKNLLGAVGDKGSMHARLHEKIAELAAILRPRLAVIDGVVACAGGELGGVPVPMGLVIASSDPVAADAVGSAIMGFSPYEIPHIALAERMGLGVADLGRIEVVGERIEEVAVDFRAVARLLGAEA